MKKIIVLSGLTYLFSGCSTLGSLNPSSGEEKMLAIAGQPQADIWFKGTVEAAFTKAKKDKSLVFLYWGAVWCPPCNELKASVFSKPRFAELMKNFVPVYLDGDTEEAQIWGERLQTSGYPTVLILDADQKELFRLGSSVSIAEFEEAIQAVFGKSQNFQTALASLKQGNLTSEGWKVLAFADWEQLPQEYGDRKQRIELLKLAVKNCPDSFSQEKILLQSALLSMTASLAEGDRPKATLEDVENIKVILKYPNQLQAMKSFIVGQADQIVSWLDLSVEEEQYRNLKEIWLSAAQKISEDPTVSVETRLGAISPELVFLKLERPKEKLPQEFVVKVQKAVQKADREAQSDFERHAVISGAAYYLRQVGDIDGARALLLKEVEKTNTPWYYQSSLANLEWEAGRTKDAQLWAAKARQSAQGRATKIQWITNDILLNGKIKSEESKTYLRSLAREYYELATELSDGFSGRNKARSLKVREVLISLKDDAEFQKTLGVYAARCQNLKAENRLACIQHFQSYQ